MTFFTRSHRAFQIEWPNPLEPFQEFIRANAYFRYSNRLEASQIRLISLLPGEGDDVIRCQLSTHAFNFSDPKKIPYIALSYTWGDAEDTLEILCNGAILKITRNLYAVLWHLRETPNLGDDIPKYYWVDAICINQSDNVEKSQQVRLMREIYHHAYTVIAWLGVETEAMIRGFARVQSFFDRIKSPDWTYPFVSASRDKRGHAYGCGEFNLILAGLPHPFDSSWEDFLSVVCSDWFSRIWTLQEILASRSSYFMCGLSFYPTNILLGMVRHYVGAELLYQMCERHHKPIRTLNVDTIATLKEALDAGQTFQLLTLINHTLLYHSSEPRDRVFALVGLANDVGPDFIDYGLTEIQLCINVAALCLENTNSVQSEPLDLDFLLSIASTFERVGDWPSWLPAFTSRRASGLVTVNNINDNLDALPWAKGAADICLPPRITANKNLVLGGRPVDKITNIVETKSLEDPNSLRLFVKRWGVLVEIMKNSYYDEDHKFVTDQVYGIAKLIAGLHISLKEYHDTTTRCFRLVESLRSYPNDQELSEVAWRSFIFSEDYNKIHQFRREEGLLHSLPLTAKSLRRLAFLDVFEYHRIRFWNLAQIVCVSTLSLTSPFMDQIRQFWPGLEIGQVSTRGFLFSLTALVANLILRASAAAYKRTKLIEFRKTLQELEVFLNGDNAYTNTWVKISRLNFCATQQGYVGWVHDICRTGDEVCFFDGSLIPFVLRKKSDALENDTTYELIGDCYLHGLMNSEGRLRIEGMSSEITLV